jgi:hypothetical protein
MMPQVASSQGEQDRPEKPSRSSDDKKLRCSHVPKPQDVTQPILGKAGDQEKEKVEKDCFVVEEIVKAFHGAIRNELIYERTAECPCEDKGHAGSEGEPDGGKHDAEEFAEQVPAEKSRHLPGNGRGNHLGDLK